MRGLKRLALAAGMLAPAAAHAGVYTDDLSRCVVSATTESDKALLVRWIFTIMARSPIVSDLGAVSAEQRLTAHRNAAQLTTRLLTADCRAQSVAALKYEGQSVIEKAFETLGSVAMRGLMEHPAVGAEIAAFSGLLDKDKIVALFKEAGISEAGSEQAK